MRPNYLNFLESVLRSIESEVEFDVYHSFLLSSIIIATEFEYFQSSLNICDKHQILNFSNCIELHKFWHYSTDLGTNSYGRDQIVYQIFFISIFDHYSYRIDSNYID